MTKAHLVSHVAAETSTIRVAAEQMVGAVFSATAEALARDEPVTTSGFGKSAVRGRAAGQERSSRTPEPVAGPASKVPSFKRAQVLHDTVNEYLDGAGRPMLAIRFGDAAAARARPRDANLQDLVLGITSAPDAPSV